MAELPCSCCTLLGEPPARVNFKILTGLPYSRERERIYYLREHHNEDGYAGTVVNSYYHSLIDVSKELFNPMNLSCSSIASLPNKCCYGSKFPNKNNQLTSSCYDAVKNYILCQLKPKSTIEKSEVDPCVQAASWIIFNDSNCMEEKFLNIFLQLKDHQAPLLDYTFTVLCLLDSEKEVFKNCILQSTTFDQYNSISIEYQRRIKDFFILLKSSSILQQRTLLVEQNKLSNSEIIQRILHRLPRNVSGRGSTFYHEMEHLFTPITRQPDDIGVVRRSLQKDYNQAAQDHLQALLNKLRQRNTVEEAAHQLIRLVLIDFKYMNAEEKSIYRRQLILGFNSYDAQQHSNSIAAQVIHYIVELISKQDKKQNSLTYALVEVICILAEHSFYCHDLFNSTPEIFTLSMSLVCQRQYPIVLGGLRLCKIILKGDRVKNKYAAMYLKYDRLAARKMMDAIKWLLAPYQTLQMQWEQEPSNNQEITESRCFEHAFILVERWYLQCLSSLLNGSVIEHCIQLTVDDVDLLVKTIDILVDQRLSHRMRNKKAYSLLLASDLCTILCPLLQYGLPQVASALRRQTRLLKAVPEIILSVLHVCKDFVDPCFHFYTLLTQSIVKDSSLNDVPMPMTSPIVNVNQPTKQITAESTQSANLSNDTLNLTRDLISSYFDLNSEYHESILANQPSTINQAQTLLNDEWEKFNQLQLKYENDRLKKENNSSDREIRRLRDELHRTQSNRAQLQLENNRLAQMLEEPRLRASSALRESTQSSLSATSLVQNTDEKLTDSQLDNVPPHTITSEQAEQFIRAIYHRRMSFADNDMRPAICGSLKQLASDLYTSPIHFLYELIQVMKIALIHASLLTLLVYRMPKTIFMLRTSHLVYVLSSMMNSFFCQTMSKAYKLVMSQLYAA